MGAAIGERAALQVVAQSEAPRAAITMASTSETASKPGGAIRRGSREESVTATGALFLGRSVQQELADPVDQDLRAILGHEGSPPVTNSI